MEVKKIEKTIELDDGRQTKFEFSQCNNEGLKEEQIDYTIELIQNYLKKYKGLVINRVTDFSANTGDFYKDAHGKSYDDMSELGKYYYAQEEIQLNHIRTSRMPFQENEFIKRIETYATKVYKVESIIDQMKYHAMKARVPFENLKTIFAEDTVGKKFIEDLHENDILTNPLEDGICSIYLIRKLEFQECIKRIMIHEIGHAIADQYGITDDQGIKSLYQKYEKDFEDIDEFIAECFMASEFASNIKVASNVRGIINKYTNVWE